MLPMLDATIRKNAGERVDEHDLVPGTSVDLVQILEGRAQLPDLGVEGVLLDQFTAQRLSCCLTVLDASTGQAEEALAVAVLDEDGVAVHAQPPGADPFNHRHMMDHPITCDLTWEARLASHQDRSGHERAVRVPRSEPDRNVTP